MPQKNLLFENFKRYIAANDMLEPSDRILLAVSGGVDSMVLMSLFYQSGYHIGVAHCNFGLRGEESDEDEELVARVAASYGVKIYNKRFDTVGEMERTGESMEMAARRLRYEWFEQLCIEHGYDKIAIAHHADDSTETFFINLLRGTGLRGLTGISSTNGRVFRPLLFASRREISEYAIANHIPFREDSSNRSTKYLRNKIRLGLIPRIREINKKFTEIMNSNIRRLTDTQLFINRAIELIRNEVCTEQEGIHTIHIDRIDPQMPRGFVIYELLNSTFDFKGDVTDALCRALESDTATGKRFYSREWVATIDRGNVVVARITSDDPCEVTVEEGTRKSFCGNSRLMFEREAIDTIENFRTPEHIAQIDVDKLQFPLKLRRWREGDWFVPYGMTGRKKISDYLTDRKVSGPERERQFVLLSGEDIVWVVGRRIDDRYRLTDETETVLRITRETI